MKPFVKGDKFLTFIIYAGKVTQILYHQFTWVSSQTDWSVISHLSRLRTTHFLRQYLKKKRFWDSFCPNEDKFNLTLFLLRALFFLPFFFLIDFITYFYISTRYHFQDLQDTKFDFVYYSNKFINEKKIKI